MFHFGGAIGIGGIPRVMFFDIRLKGIPFFLLCLGFLILVLLICWWFTQSWASLAATLSGKKKLRPQPWESPLFVSSCWPLSSGLPWRVSEDRCMRITCNSSVPVIFLFQSCGFLSMLVLGGIGTLWGSVVGTLILGILPELFRPLVDYRIFFYTLLLLLMIRFNQGDCLGGKFCPKDHNAPSKRF